MATSILYVLESVILTSKGKQNILLGIMISDYSDNYERKKAMKEQFTDIFLKTSS